MGAALKHFGALRAERFPELRKTLLSSRGKDNFLEDKSGAEIKAAMLACSEGLLSRAPYCNHILLYHTYYCSTVVEQQ